MTPHKATTAKQRRRDRRLLARLRAVPYPPRCVYLNSEPDFRSARRLQRAGLVCAVASKWSFCRALPKEIRVYETRAAACTAGFGACIMRDR